MSRCAHFDEIQKIIAAGTTPGVTAKYPQPPADEVAACPDRCHDVWKIINGYPIPDRTSAP